LDTQTIREIRHSGALREIDMTWVVIVSLGSHVSAVLSREMDERRCASSVRLLRFCFFFLIRPLMASFKKSSFKFCPKSVSFATRQYHYLSGERLTDDINITQ
jgi:hypothetical protein